MSNDAVFMRRAIELAHEGWGQTAPNPMVGAVVVSDGEIVGEGFHARFGEAHAEPVALRVAGDRARGATLFVSLEPCSHHGKTPPCVDAIIAAKVARVVIATRDPNPQAAGGGERLRTAGIDVTIGVEEAAARELNAPFFHAFDARAPKRPWVTLKLAISADDAIAHRVQTESNRWITGELARREAHRLRARSDAIAVGVGTVLADDPVLTVRDVRAPRVPPLRVVFDSRARTPVGSALARTAREIPVVVFVRDDRAADADALRRAGVEVLAHRSIDDALRILHERGVQSLLVEGGAALTGSFIAAGVVDRLVIFQAPVRLGAGALGAFSRAPAGFAESLSRLPVLERRAFADDVMTVYAMRPMETTGVHRAD